MFGIEVSRFKEVEMGDWVYKIPVIGLIFSKEKAEHPDRFANVGEPYTSGNHIYVNVPITKDAEKSARVANYIANSCGDSRVIYSIYN